MAILPIDNLEPGMTLKSAVSDRSGRLLLPAGVELDEKHLKIFRTWGISEADIEGESEEEESIEEIDFNVDPLVMAKAQQEVEQLFIHNDVQHQMIRELMRICISKRVASAR